jgi:cysteine-rich repeat protein
MQSSIPKETAASARRLRRLRLTGATLTVLVLGACTDDAIVYPNRNLTAPAGGAMSTAGSSGDAGAATGGAPSGGSGGLNNGGGGSPIALGGGDDLGDAGAAGTTGAPDQCGDGVVEPPEECDDKNKISGDGCSAACKSSCETCESKVCSLDTIDFNMDSGPSFAGCYGPNQATITTGPAVGVLRTQVCSDLIDCVRHEKCGQRFGDSEDVRFLRCWCDVDWSNIGTAVQKCTNDATFVPGKCASRFQDASEGDALADIPKSQQSTNKALGAALRLLQTCDERVCVEECLPEYFTDVTVATITADLSTTRNAAGESQLGDLTADAQRAAAGSDIAIVLDTALCQDPACQTLTFSATPNRPADADGRVLWSEAYATQDGYGEGLTSGPAQHNQASGGALFTETFTGQQLYDALNQQFTLGRVLYVSGLTYSWDGAQPLGARIVEIRKDGTPIDKAATFSVALTDFLTGTPSTGGLLVPQGGVPTLTVGTDRTVVPNVSPAPGFGKYLSTLPQPISPPDLNRITCTNCGN